MGLFDRLFGQEDIKEEKVKESVAPMEEDVSEAPQEKPQLSVMEAYHEQMKARLEEVKKQEALAQENLTLVEDSVAQESLNQTSQEGLTSVSDYSEQFEEKEASQDREIHPETDENEWTTVNDSQKSNDEGDFEGENDGEDQPEEVQEEVATEVLDPIEEQVAIQDVPSQGEMDEVEAQDGPTHQLPQSEEPQEQLQEKYDRTLKKTRTGLGARINAFFANFRSVDEDFFEELEEMLILSDVGVQVASQLTETLRQEAKLENAKKPEQLKRLVIETLVDLYEKDGVYNEKINYQEGLTVMLFVGVNGVGKTTSIGKLAYQLKNQGKKVMLVAADTFRAGAVAQLEEWAKRVEVDFVKGPDQSDPASVVFDGMERAVAEGVDVLLIDTAGRLQNKDNLMAELEKIGRIIKRVLPDAPHETFLALDASTGQNALVQAKEFSKITPVTGIVLTKLDGTAKGGVVLAIREELDIPVKLIGFGEKIDDIGPFQSENFMKGLLEGIL